MTHKEYVYLLALAWDEKQKRAHRFNESHDKFELLTTVEKEMINMKRYSNDRFQFTNPTKIIAAKIVFIQSM